MKSNNNKQLDFTEIMSILWNRKWLMVIPLVLVTLISIGGSYLITPIYQSAVIIWIGDKVQLSAELKNFIGEVRQGYRSAYDRRMELKSLQNEVTSSPYVSQLIENLQLDKDPEIEKEALKTQASSPNVPLDQIKLDILVGRLRENIDISIVGTDQIQIMIQSADPFLARDMAEALGEIYISEKKKQQIGSAKQSEDFTYDQLAKYEENLQARINEKTEFEKEVNKIQLDAGVMSDENRREIQSEINNTQLEIDDKKEEERKYIGDLKGIVSGSMKITESNDLKSKKRQVKNHLGSIASLMQKYTWSAAEILNHKARLFNLIRDIEDENELLVNQQFSDLSSTDQQKLVGLTNVKSELDILYSRSNSLKLALDELNSKIDMIPEYQARLDQLDREVFNAVDLRDKFKEQQEGSQISQALVRESNYKIIEPAKIPMAPYKPNRKQIAIMGFLLGLAIGGGTVLLTELLDKSLRKIEDVEAAIGFPVIGVVPQIETVKKLKIKK